MNPALSNAEAIFAAALEINEASERAAFLSLACGNNAELLANVQSLLRASEEATSFLEVNPALAEILAEEDTSLRDVQERVGRYKLLEKIGEGGFGDVWMAEQEEPVRRRVAFKIIKLGMDTREVVARFQAERQALALMDHPNIARVFDAGTTESGRPYFVMELVRGVPIVQFCDEAQLSAQQRLSLFLLVCRAVHHAHQKGVIHRDLKPSNILVAEVDGKPVPKIIDFGIAKATEFRLTQETLFTRFHQLLGTPAYMSPEQANMSSVDVDTRSDVYSLGVLMFELLTGRTPFTKEELFTGGFEHLCRTIREKEPVRPSTAVTLHSAERKAEVAAARSIDFSSLRAMLTGDLDWVVMKALEKERSRRYDSAIAFAHDVERYLNRRPVAAAPPNKWYRVAKFVSRHRLAVTTSTIFVLLLLSTAYFSIWQAIRAVRAEANMASERDAAGRAKLRAQRLQEESEHALVRRVHNDAERLFTEGRAREGIAALAWLLRRNARNTVASARLIAALSARDIPLLIAEALPDNELLAFSQDGRLAIFTGAKEAVTIWDIEKNAPLGSPVELGGPPQKAWLTPDGRNALVSVRGGAVQVLQLSPFVRIIGTMRNVGEMHSVIFNDSGDVALTSFAQTRASAPARSGEWIYGLNQFGLQLWSVPAAGPLGGPVRHDDQAATHWIAGLLNEAGDTLLTAIIEPPTANSAPAPPVFRLWRLQDQRWRADRISAELAKRLNESSEPALLHRDSGVSGASQVTVSSSDLQHPVQILSPDANSDASSAQANARGFEGLSFLHPIRSSQRSTFFHAEPNNSPLGEVSRHEFLVDATSTASAIVRHGVAKVIDLPTPVGSQAAVRVRSFSPDLSSTSDIPAADGFPLTLTTDGERALGRAGRYGGDVDRHRGLRVWDVRPSRAFLPSASSCAEEILNEVDSRGRFAVAIRRPWDRELELVVVNLATGLRTSVPWRFPPYLANYEWIALSLSGDRLAFAEEGAMKVVSPESPADSVVIRSPGVMRPLSFSPDDRFLLCRAGRSLLLFDLRAPNEPPRVFPGCITGEWSADGRFLSIGRAHGTPEIYSASSFERIAGLPPLLRNFRWVSSAGSLWSAFEGKRAQTVDLSEAKARVVDIAAATGLQSFVVATTGRHAILTTEDGSTELRDLQKNVKVLQRSPPERIDSFAPDGSGALILSASGAVQLLRLATLDIRVVAPTTRTLLAALSPDGRWLATAHAEGANHVVRCWDAASGIMVSEPLTVGKSVTRLRFGRRNQVILERASAPGQSEAISLNIPAVADSAPEWFIALCENIAGTRLEGEGISAPIEPRVFRDSALPRTRSGDGFERWATWFLNRSPERAVTPYGGGSVREYAAALIAENRLDSLLAAGAANPAADVHERIVHRFAISPPAPYQSDPLEGLSAELLETNRWFLFPQSASDIAIWCRAEILRREGNTAGAESEIARIKTPLAFPQYWHTLALLANQRSDTNAAMRTLERARAALQNTQTLNYWSLRVLRCAQVLLARAGRSADAAKLIPASWKIPSRDSSFTSDQIDLQPIYTLPLQGLPSDYLPQDDEQTTTLHSVTPTFSLNVGASKVDGLLFDTRGLVIVPGANPNISPLDYLIPINQSARALHFLHSALDNAESGRERGAYVIEYADGAVERVPLIMGQNIGSAGGGAPLPAATVIPAASKTDYTFAHFTWQNPHPDKPIARIHFTASGPAAWILLGITLER